MAGFIDVLLRVGGSPRPLAEALATGSNLILRCRASRAASRRMAAGATGASWFETARRRASSPSGDQLLNVPLRSLNRSSRPGGRTSGVCPDSHDAGVADAAEGSDGQL